MRSVRSRRCSASSGSLPTSWAGSRVRPFVRSLAMLAAPFLLPLLVHLVVAFPTGRPVARLRRRGGLLRGGRLQRRPRAVPGSLPGPPLLEQLHRQRLPRPRRPRSRAVARRRLAPRVRPRRPRPGRVRRLAAGPGDARGAGGALGGPRAGRARRDREAAYAIALIRDPSEDPERGVFAAFFLARALAFTALAAGVTWIFVRDRRARAAVSRLAADLGAAPAPGSLQAALARSLGDQRLEVAYWLPGSQRYVDDAGRPVEPPTAGSERRRSSGTASPSRSSSMTAGSRRRTSSSARSARPRDSRSTTSGCKPSCWPSSRTCARLAPASSRQATRRGGASSATSTTARSSGCSRSSTSSVSPLARRRTATTLHARRRLRRGAGGARGAARPRARHPPGDPHRGRARACALGRSPTRRRSGRARALPDERPGRRRACRVSRGRRRDRGTREARRDARRRHRSAAGRRCSRSSVDGPPPAPPVDLADRVGALGGRLFVAGKVLHAEIPCA